MSSSCLCILFCTVTFSSFLTVDPISTESTISEMRNSIEFSHLKQSVTSQNTVLHPKGYLIRVIRTVSPTRTRLLGPVVCLRNYRFSSHIPVDFMSPHSFHGQVCTYVWFCVYYVTFCVENTEPTIAMSVSGTT